MRKNLVCLFMVLLGSCATSAQNSAGNSGATATSGAVQVSMHVEALSQRERRQYIMRTADTLHSGDGVALYFKVDRPAYAYVAMIPPNGTPTVLYPQGSEQLIEPGVELRIPKAGDWLFLDEKGGQENLFLVTSKRPLSESDQDLCRALALPCVITVSDKPPPPPPPPPPGNLDIKTRGRKHKQGAILQAETDDGGVAVLRFSFQHEK